MTRNDALPNQDADKNINWFFFLGTSLYVIGLVGVLRSSIYIENI